MYATVAAAAALHQVLLRSLGDDKVVVQNVASGLFCVLFVALGVVDRPSLLAASMLGYLISDSTCVTTAGYAMHHSVTAMLLLVSLRGNGAYDDLTVVLGGYGEASTVLLCVADTFKQRPRLQKAYPRFNQAARYAFALAFFVLRVGYWSASVWKSTNVSGARKFFTKSLLGDDAAVLAVEWDLASMAWRATRRFCTNAP